MAQVTVTAAPVPPVIEPAVDLSESATAVAVQELGAQAVIDIPPSSLHPTTPPPVYPVLHVMVSPFLMVPLVCVEKSTLVSEQVFAAQVIVLKVPAVEQVAVCVAPAEV